MKKVLVLVAIAVLTCSVASATVNPSNQHNSAKAQGTDGIRANGTFGSPTATITQTGPLQVDVVGTVTTAGGDGLTSTVTLGGNVYTLNDQVFVYAQIYDSPWVDGCTSWATPGVNFCDYALQYFTNSPTALGSFSVSFTTTVPAPDNYQAFVIAYAGRDWPLPSYNWWNVSQTAVAGPLATTYVYATLPTPTPSPTPGGPTATPDPDAGGNPIPTLNRWGVAAMIVLLVGGALLLITRRN